MGEPVGLFPPTYEQERMRVVHAVYRFKLIYALAGLVLGSLCMIVGLVLFLFGVFGSTNVTADFLGAESKLSDAAPGSVIFFIGMFIVFLTRMRMVIRTSSGSAFHG